MKNTDGGTACNITVSADDMLARAISERDAELAETAKLRDALSESVDLAEEGWAYAPEYFRNKWRCKERIAKLRAEIKKLQTRMPIEP